MAIIDCRELACPEPVVRTKKALDQLKEGKLVVIVNDTVSRNNVERFACSQGCSVEVEKKEEEFHIHIHKGKGEIGSEGKRNKVVVYINSQYLGMGDEALGNILIRSFLKTLLDLQTRPVRMIFINSGVRLTSEGSQVLEALKALSERGVEILSCGTCLDFYGLKEKLSVGVISNMYDIVQALMEADHILRP